jgi:Domain of unknown function (DUF4331)
MFTPASSKPQLALIALASALCAMSAPSLASSHREAPYIAGHPKLDGTDFYMFNSYESGRTGYTTLIANYQPLQDAYGGPNYFVMDPQALYEIHIDNDGDAKEDLSFQFRFKNNFRNFKGLDAASAGNSIPLIAKGPVSNVRDANLNIAETYELSLVRGTRRGGSRSVIGTFDKPVDYAGVKTLGAPAAYEAYAQKHIAEFSVPGCSSTKKARVFAGQRQEAFAVNLGTIFDLVNADLATLTSARGDGTANTVADKNVTGLAIELPTDCLTGTGNGVIGGWTTASLPQATLLSASPKSGHQTTASAKGAWVQVSRLGMPLVNEVVIGLKDKDRFNGSMPAADGQFADYVTKPTFPALLSTVLTGNSGLAPTFARTDLVSIFLTGIPGVNQLAKVTGSEMLRLNTGIAAVPRSQQNPLGAVGSILGAGSVEKATDLAGFPNGRRPNDDVVDITLIAATGGVCTQPVIDAGLVLGGDCIPANVPAGNTTLKFTDKADQEKVVLLDRFPYLNTPVGGTK